MRVMLDSKNNNLSLRLAVGTEDVKVTAMNMYKYKEGLRFCKRWPFSTYILILSAKLANHRAYTV